MKTLELFPDLKKEYDLAQTFAQSMNFKSVQAYTDYIKENKTLGFLADPRQYDGWTNTLTFLGITKAEDYQHRMSKINQAERVAKAAKTRERNKANKLQLSVVSQPVALPQPQTEQHFTLSEVANILLAHNVSMKDVIDFADNNKPYDVVQMFEVIKNHLASKV